jgi:hypothetical protein
LKEVPTWRRAEPVVLFFAAGFTIGLIFPFGRLAARVAIVNRTR